MSSLDLCIGLKRSSVVFFKYIREDEGVGALSEGYSVGLVGLNALKDEHHEVVNVLERINPVQLVKHQQRVYKPCDEPGHQ
jgi:hypothetical protein